MKKTRQTMRVVLLGFATLSIGILGIGSRLAVAQQKQTGGNSEMAGGKNPMIGMIFCDKMQTGELCPRGTANTLKLSGEANERWLAAVHEYDKAIEAANRRFLAECKPVLSPQQYSETSGWFEKGLNPLLNKLLVEQGRLEK